MCEVTARARLKKCCRVLHKTKDAYGVPGYYVSDFNNVIVYGMPTYDLVTMEDVVGYIRELEDEV